jgi:hypothetical protein
MTVHILYEGLPLCGFSTTVPRDWPEGHRWVTIEDRTPLSEHGNVDADAQRCKVCERQRELLVSSGEAR